MLPNTADRYAVDTAFRDVKGKLYPSVGVKKAGEHIRVNFGHMPFVFDIDGLMKVCIPWRHYSQ
jgi:hypothetical protein